MPGYVTVPKSVEFTLHPFARGTMTANGVQYSTVVNSNAAAANEAFVETVTANVLPFGYPGYSGKFAELEMGLTAAFKPKDEATNSSITYRWQGKNIMASTWTDIVTNTTILPNANGINPFVDYSWAGYVAPAADFNSIPVQIRLVIQCNTASNAQAKTKNSSYVSAKYYID